jgi:hypothetical protein
VFDELLKLVRVTEVEAVVLLVDFLVEKMSVNITRGVIEPENAHLGIVKMARNNPLHILTRKQTLKTNCSHSARRGKLERTKAIDHLADGRVVLLDI